MYAPEITRACAGPSGPSTFFKAPAAETIWPLSCSYLEEIKWGNYSIRVEVANKKSTVRGYVLDLKAKGLSGGEDSLWGIYLNSKSRSQHRYWYGRRKTNSKVSVTVVQNHWISQTIDYNPKVTLHTYWCRLSFSPIFSHSQSLSNFTYFDRRNPQKMHIRWASTKIILCTQSIDNPYVYWKAPDPSLLSIERTKFIWGCCGAGAANTTAQKATTNTLVANFCILLQFVY